MAVEKYTVAEVDTKEGWVTFANTDDPTETFRRTMEVHLMVHGRKPSPGDTFAFTTAVNLMGQKFHYYVEDRKPDAK